MAKADDGLDGQKEGAHQTPVNLCVQPLLERPQEYLKQIGHLLGLFRSAVLVHHKEDPSWCLVVHITNSPEGVFSC